MRLIIKEYPDVPIIESLVPFVQEDIEAYRFINIQDVMLDDYIICSEKDSEFLELYKWKYKCLIYEELYNSIPENMNADYRYNYDYYHLNYELQRAGNPGIDTIITGSSYGVFAINPKQMRNAVNLSMISQDLYYSLRLIYKALDNNTGIKRVILFASFYFFHVDISRETNKDELARISKVYDRIFGDLHSCSLLAPRYDLLYKSCLFDVPKMQQMLIEQECPKGYFNENKYRRDCAFRNWDKKETEWPDLDMEDKAEAGKQRALGHMKATRYKNSLMENKIFLRDFVDFAKENGIEVFILIPPHSKYYLDHVSEICRSEFYETLNGLNVSMLDYSGDPRLSDEDFIDMDHLNDQGAEKFSMFLKDDLKRKSKLMV